MYSRKEFENFIKNKYPKAIFKYPDTSKDIFWNPGKELQFYMSKESYDRDIENVMSCYVSPYGKFLIATDF